jgi:hypothetical protein
MILFDGGAHSKSTNFEYRIRNSHNISHSEFTVSVQYLARAQRAAAVAAVADQP